MIAILNALDLENLNPGIREPPIAQKSYYLRYRVSDDEGKTWKFDQPIIQQGNFTAKNPFSGVFIGKNAIYIGDRGSRPLVTKNGKILVPAQTTILGADSELSNPGNGHTYTDAVVLIGSWVKDNSIAWEMSARITGDPERSTRGMIEPTLIALNNGHLVVVMRGSNEQKGSKNYTLPGYKWLSVSKDEGKHWSKPEPLRFENGREIYSPSSMSTLFKHSSGRCFWIGNMTTENNEGNLPRWPLVCIEMNTKNLRLKESTLLVLDTRQEEDKLKGRLDISHFSVIEDRKTKEMIITYPRSYNAYKLQEWITMHIKVD
ncbi:exo-alpha-sialidase [Pedobacter africanus]|nr:exo-alpha-sialidase [Pedobacter africanus]